jgi:tetratricopeptide (TPR) repeat protein
MRILSGRKPEIFFFAALLVFIITLTTRALNERFAPPSPPQAASQMPEAARELSDPRTIGQLQDHLRANPDDANAYANLGLALLQRVRETGDLALYAQAQEALDAALDREPEHLDALIGQGALALAQHRFVDALDWGERARAVNPYRAAVYGIIGDAEVELGRYEEALDTVQTMVNTRPDLNSYSRASYLRELQGDTAGAIELMELAVSAGAPGSENTLWTQVQLGNLYWNSGDRARAEETYNTVLALRPDYAYAQAGIARVRVAQGNSDEALAIYEGLVQRLPLPEFVIAYGELYQSLGENDKAQQQYDLVRAMQQLNAAAGVNVDLELALFEADHGAAPDATQIAAVRAAFEERPSLYAADVLAMTLYRAGQYAEAQRYSDLALRLGTRDATWHYHAGIMAYARGDMDKARTHLESALTINPNFSPLHAPEARRILKEIAP